jgi:hypothetical protein
MYEPGDEGGIPMISQSSGMNGRRYKVMAEGVHLQDRCQTGFVSEIIGIYSFGQGGTCSRLDGDEVHIGMAAVYLVPRERE